MHLPPLFQTLLYNLTRLEILTCHMTLIEKWEDNPPLDEVDDEIMKRLCSMKLRIEVIEWDMSHSELLAYLTPWLPLEYMEEDPLHQYHPREFTWGEIHRMTKPLHTIVVACLDEMKADEPHLWSYKLWGMNYKIWEIGRKTRQKKDILHRHRTVSL